MTTEKEVSVDAISSYLPQGIALLLSGFLLLVIWYDFREFIIPNGLNLAIAALFLPAAYFLHLPILWSLAAAGLMLGLAICLFLFNFMGGGDAKLLPALMLWTGWGATSFEFLVLMAILGGALAFVLLIVRWLIPQSFAPPLFKRGAPIPYGIPIALAFLILLWQREIFPF